MTTLLSALVLLVLGVSYATAELTNHQIWMHWEKFKMDNNIQSNEDFGIFKDNLIKSLAHNTRRGASYQTQVSIFSLLRENESLPLSLFGLRSGGRERATNGSNVSSWSNREGVILPETVDWRSTFTNEPKFQSRCGSCYAFSTAGVLESLYYTKFNRREEFSIQQIVDCTKSSRNIAASMKNYGCRGGWPDNSFEYMKQVGLTPATNYQYRGQEGICKEGYFGNRVRINGYGDVPYGNEESLKKAVAWYGPVAVGIDASQWGFAHYKSGVYIDSTCSRTNLNHAVIVVGYGTENGQDYWLVRNSWGTGWGERGYVKIARNMNNQCGIASLASFAYL